MNIKAYLKSGGCDCPDCGSPDIVGGSVEIGLGEAFQELTCSSCGAEWQNLYRLVGIARPGQEQDIPYPIDLYWPDDNGDDDEEDTLEEWDLMDATLASYAVAT